MFDFIPIEYYTPVFYNILLIVVFGVVLNLFTKGYTIQNLNKKEFASIWLFLAVSLYMGLRPINGVFVDMTNYNRTFEYYASGAEVKMNFDILWAIFVKFCSGIMTAPLFFLLCAVLYVFPLYKAAKNWLGKDRYFLFLMFIASFSFWAYGTNGIRNGIATSIFVLALSFYRKKYWQYVSLAMSYFIHGSMMIPIAAYILTLFYKNPKHYLLGWIVTIPISLIFGSQIEIFVTSLGLGGERLQYLTMDTKAQFSSSGFRWDFVLYSVAPLYAGYYFIIKRKFKDEIYIQLFNIYVAVNAFWILVIRAAYSNRFAYLSWFLMAVIIFYPFFKKQFFKKQQKVLAYVVLVYFGFTYFMNVII
mgnify:CR=1 FL=1